MYLRNIFLIILFTSIQQLALGQNKEWVKSDLPFFMLTANTSLKKADASLLENLYHFKDVKTSELNPKSIYSSYGLQNVNDLEIRKYHKKAFYRYNFPMMVRTGQKVIY